MLIVGDENETRNFPLVNSFLILSCVAVFIWQIVSLKDMGFVQYGVVPSRFLDHLALAELATLITAVFMHGDLFHIIGNMWYLFIFGDNIEDHFGHFNYLAFYLTCGVVGGLTEIAFNPTMSIPSVGASGAIAGVLGAYIVLYPQAGIKTWWGGESILFGFRTFTIPAWLAIGGWFVMQYVFLLLELPGVGWHCHIGGFTAGMLTVFLFRLAGERSAENGFVTTSMSESNAWFRVVFSILLVGAFAVTAIAYVGGSYTSKKAPAITKSVEEKASARGTENQSPTPAIVSSRDRARDAGQAAQHKHRKGKDSSKTRRHSPKRSASAPKEHKEVRRHNQVSHQIRLQQQFAL